MGNLNRIREWRDRRGLTLEQLADAAGLSPSFLWRMEAGQRNVSMKNLAKLSEALNIPLRALVGEPGSVQVPLVGYVGAGAEAHFFADGQGPFEMIDAPEGSTEATVAVEIRGESLGTFFTNWLVFYDEVRDPVTDDLVGKLCVCGLPDGRVLIKKLARGKVPGVYTLLSQFEGPIFDQEVSWAACVKNLVQR